MTMRILRRSTRMGVPLINNAYYRRDGKIYVWMGEWVEWE